MQDSGQLVNRTPQKKEDLDPAFLLPFPFCVTEPSKKLVVWVSGSNTVQNINMGQGWHSEQLNLTLPKALRATWFCPAFRALRPTVSSPKGAGATRPF